VSKARSKDWLDGYLAGLGAVDLMDGDLRYDRLFDLDGSASNLEDAKKEARAAWSKAREVPPSGLAVTVITRQKPKGRVKCIFGLRQALTTHKTTEKTEKPDKNPADESRVD